MDRTNNLFLQALKASLTGDRVSWTTDEVSPEDFNRIFKTAKVHHVVPMIFEAVYDCPAFSEVHPQQVMLLRRSVTQDVFLQAMKTEEFSQLFGKMMDAGVRPCVVKGVICRGLYPNPDERASADEDVLIREEDFEKVHKLFLENGMVLKEPGEDPYLTFEVPYIQENGVLFIELHKQLFPPESEAYGDLNLFFEKAHDRLMNVTVGDGHFLTMHPTDHMLYLICHSFKHFLHSGFGLRQVCDIILFANAYGSEIDWTYVLDSCREIRADLFAASMFRIGEKYLVFDPKKACFTDEWQAIEVDETGMLQDLLESGVFGQADMSRKHSSNITLDAVIAEKRGKKAKTSIVGSLFPSINFMKKGYPYLERFPFLLPVAWLQRIWNYRKESGKRGSGNSAADSIRIGSRRVELLRQYGIIE